MACQRTPLVSYWAPLSTFIQVHLRPLEQLQTPALIKPIVYRAAWPSPSPLGPSLWAPSKAGVTVINDNSLVVPPDLSPMVMQYLLNQDQTSLTGVRSLLSILQSSRPAMKLQSA